MTSIKIEAVDQPVKVFRLNDAEWWMGFDLESTIEFAMKEVGLSREELLDDFIPMELTDEEFDKLVIAVDWSDLTDEQMRRAEESTIVGEQSRVDVPAREFILDFQYSPALFCSTEY